MNDNQDKPRDEVRVQPSDMHTAETSEGAAQPSGFGYTTPYGTNGNFALPVRATIRVH